MLHEFVFRQWGIINVLCFCSNSLTIVVVRTVDMRPES